MYDKQKCNSQEENHVRPYTSSEPTADLYYYYFVSDLWTSFYQSSAGPFGNSHTSVIAENTGDIAVLSSDKDQNIKLNISGTDISVSPSATPSPTPVKEQDAENVSPEAESGTWTADGTNWKFMVNGKAYTGWLTDTDGHRYYFNKKGIMQTGWLETGKKRYYLDEDGIMQTGTITIDGQKYTFASDGSLKK